MGGVDLNLEFSGGCEFLVGNQKQHKVSIPCNEDFVTVAEVICYVRDEMLKERVKYRKDRTPPKGTPTQQLDCNRRELLIEGETIRPGVLVLVNECDWELLGCEKARLHPGDLVTFISTLHGG